MGANEPVAPGGPGTGSHKAVTTTSTLLAQGGVASPQGAVYPQKSHPPFIRAHLPGKGIVPIAGEDELRAALADPAAAVWVDFHGRSRESDSILEKVFGFHPLAIEDVYHDFHRPKLEDYEQYLYLILQCLDKESNWDLDHVGLVELDLFLGKNFVVTHHAGPCPAVDATQAALDKSGAALPKGAVFLAHGLIDRAVDQFLPIPRVMAERIEEMENNALADPSPELLEQILSLTRSVQWLKRFGTQQRDVLSRLARSEITEVPREARPFFRDVDDHWAAFLESLESRRDQLGNLFQAFHLLSSYRMNQAMRVLTGISTIMLPLTFIAGIYGMNFDVMPELRSPMGYPITLLVMAAVGIGMAYWFRTRHWL